MCQEDELEGGGGTLAGGLLATHMKTTNNNQVQDDDCKESPRCCPSCPFFFSFLFLLFSPRW